MLTYMHVEPESELRKTGSEEVACYRRCRICLRAQALAYSLANVRKCAPRLSAPPKPVEAEV